MEQPIIAKKIKNQGNLIAGCGAFIGLGIAGISALTLSPVATLMLCGSMIPLALDVIGLKLLIEKPDSKSIIQNTWWLDIPFRKSIDKWIVNYIDDSESLTEKKYKVGCLSVWMNLEGITLSKVSDGKTYQYLSSLSKELNDYKETQKEIPLQYFFGDAQGAIKNILGVEPSIKTFLNEDKNAPEKIEVAKKVYKEYSKLGMAAKTFLHRTNFEELLLIQEHKFTPEDYNAIEDYIKNVEKGIKQHNISFISVNLYSDETKEALSKVINTENNINNLKVLEKYCSVVLSKSSCEIFADIARKKIEYLELDEQLKMKDVSDKPKAKKMKI